VDAVRNGLEESAEEGGGSHVGLFHEFDDGELRSPVDGGPKLPRIRPFGNFA